MKKYFKLFLIALLLFPLSILALTKSETVYSTLDNSGKVNSTIVTSHLYNTEKRELEDETMLTNILNINGKEKFELSGNKLKWKALGNDIFYRGNADKLLPISTKITYYLNDKKMKPKDMIGKKGSVKINLSFVNNMSNELNINGINETLYTPFVVTIGTILDSSSKNINITNGKVVNTGGRNILVGISSPGLYESTNISSLKDLDKITITYDTNNFKLNNIYIVSTPKLLENSDLEIFNKMDNITNNLNELQKNMNVIENSTNKINSGSNELKTKLGEAIKILENDNSDALSDEQINMIKDKTVLNVKNTLTDEYKEIIANNTWNQVKQNLNNNDDEVVNIISESVKSAVIEYLNTSGKYNDYVNCETGKVIMANGGNMSQEQIISCGVISNDTLLPLIQQAATTSALKASSNISEYVAEKVSKQVAISILEIASISTAETVSITLSKEVSNEVKKESIKTITSSLNELYNGVSLLDNGLNELSKGIKKFNNEGINTLTNYSYKINEYSNKLEALINLGKNYKGYTSNNSDSTVFISLVKSIK